MKKLRINPKSVWRLISANRRRLIRVAVGAIVGAVIGGLIEGMDYAVFLADVQHRYGIDPFEFGSLGYLGYKAVIGAVIGVIGGLGGAYCSVFIGFDSARMRKIVVRTAGVAAIAGVATAVTCVALAAFGVAVITLPGPLGAATLAGSLGNLFISTCAVAAGVVVGAVRARD